MRKDEKILKMFKNKKYSLYIVFILPLEELLNARIA
jgi:hypothetical protein